MFVGAAIGAVTAKRYGYLLVVRVGSYLSTAATIIMLFIPWISGVLIMRFLVGTLYSMIIYPVFLLAMEVCKPSIRTTVGILLGLPYAVMMMGVSGIAYLIRDWRLFTIAGAFPCLFLLPLTLFIDESPRWLVVMGRLEEATMVFERAARLNRTKLPNGFDLRSVIKNIHKNITGKEGSKTSNEGDIHDGVAEPTPDCDICMEFSSHPGNGACICQPRSTLSLDDGVGPWWAGPVALFRTSTMRKQMLVLLCVWFLQGILYIGLPLSSGTFRSPFLYLVILGMAEIPAYTLTIPITRWLGRKKVSMFGLIGGGTSLFVYLAITELGVQKDWVHLFFSYVTYLLVCTAYEINFLFSSELMPTTLRSLGTAACILSCFAGFSVTPFITHTISRVSWLPLAVFGFCGVLGGSLIFLLPETNGRALPETVEDLRVQMYKGGYSKISGTEATISSVQNSKSPIYGSTDITMPE